MTPALILAAAALAVPPPPRADGPEARSLRRSLDHGAAAVERWPDHPRFGRLLDELRVPARRRRSVERVRADRAGVRVVYRDGEPGEFAWGRRP